MTLDSRQDSAENGTLILLKLEGQKLHSHSVVDLSFSLLANDDEGKSKTYQQVIHAKINCHENG